MPKQIDLKKTINLPRTDFSMKANLTELEPRILAQWEEMGLEKKIRAERHGQTKFILHDGPPYANGHIHLGHALNKILKDLIVKSKTMEGYDSPYIPGWDCHGLPIEIKIVGQKKEGMNLLEIRRKCREYAARFVGIQKEEFQRLGVFGDWDRPYLTMNKEYEAQTARLFGSFVEKGSVYKGLKPVHWCTSCETALAEAEVEYEDHTSPSVYVKFPLPEGATGLHPELAGRRVYGLIWTTTPWTLPANLAICFHPDFQYSLVEVADEIYVVAEELLEQVARECGFDSFRRVATVAGTAFKGLMFRHPWVDRPSPGILANHVTLEQGTGLVHTAPGHGQEDYVVGVENGLEVYCPVDGKGKFDAEVEHFAGLQVFDANQKITQYMEQNGVLVAAKDISHSYPHCWRCHNPVIFRATPQWFITMDHDGLRSRSLQEIAKVRWIPSWGQERISNMVATRPDWCISRQRIWGVPIVSFYCKKCHEPLLRREIVDYVADIFRRESADAWYARPVAELLPEGTSCDCGFGEFEKEYDILDVWFDSGASQHVVLGNGDELPWPADVYLEGPDQYRGWFHSSLLVAVGVRDAAPYRIVVCNGWTLDEDGHAMSKSRGNVISPLDILKKDGAEILRLWVASINYTEDVRLGEETLSRLREAYRKLRNTSRFLVGNLFDFDPAQPIPREELSELDRWALARVASAARRSEEAYRQFEFHSVYHTLYNLAVVDLSSFYLDVLKDRLYTAPADSPARRSAQTSMFRITDTLVRLLAPILPFTCEELWRNLHRGDSAADSVHLTEFSREIDNYEDGELLERWEPLLKIRSEVSKALEESRQNKEIGNSLEAMVSIRCGRETCEYLKTFEDLRYLFIVSQVKLSDSSDLSGDQLEATVSRAPGQKCQRCWNYSLAVGTFADVPMVCDRCYQTLQEIGDAS